MLREVLGLPSGSTLQQSSDARVVKARQTLEDAHV